MLESVDSSDCKTVCVLMRFYEVCNVNEVVVGFYKNVLCFVNISRLIAFEYVNNIIGGF